MDRREWNEIVGGGLTIVDDLEWKLFQARRCIKSMEDEIAENDGTGDRELLAIWRREIRDVRIALAALYRADETRLLNASPLIAVGGPVIKGNIDKPGKE